MKSSKLIAKAIAAPARIAGFKVGKTTFLKVYQEEAPKSWLASICSLLIDLTFGKTVIIT